MTQQTSRVAQETGDLAGAVTLVGVLAEVVPIILGVAAIAWYTLRFANWYRVNYLGKDSWKGM